MLHQPGRALVPVCRVRVGARVGLQWALTFSYWTYTQTLIPTINVATSPSLPQASDAAITVAIQDTQQASTPLSGSYSLAIGEFCDTVQVAVGEPPESLQAKLLSLPGMPADVDVTSSGSVHSVLSYTVSFPALAGGMLALRVADSTLSGSTPSIAVTVVQQGSSELFYAPIPADLLRVPVLTNKGIELEVNGAPSACGPTLEGSSGLVPGSTIAAGAMPACDFETSASATPLLSSVVPNGTITPINVLVSMCMALIIKHTWRAVVSSQFGQHAAGCSPA